MTETSGSGGRVHDGSASEVPFLWLERVRLDHECDPVVWLTLAVRLVHAKDRLVKTDCLKQSCVQGVFRARLHYQLLELRNGAPFYTLSGV